MLMRIWKVALAPGRGPDLEAFAQRHSLPMFRDQPGCLGVLFTRTDRHCVTVTIWDSAQALDAMECAAHYREVVGRIERSGLLGDDHHTEVFSVYGGHLEAELARRLDA